MIYITGDTHGDWMSRLNVHAFPEQKEMTKDDIVIICGDFGIWNDTKQERYNLDWLESKPFTTLFVDGNHECLHKDTEVLTSNGWINIVEVFNNIHKYKVASVNLDTHVLDFDYSLGSIKKYSDKMLEITSSNFKQCTTLNHDLVLCGRKIKAKDIIGKDYRIENFRFNVINPYNHEIDLSNEIIEILTTIIMDATVVDYSIKNPNSHKVRIQYHLKKNRKIIYIQNILEDQNIPYTIRKAKDGTVYICIYGDSARWLYSLLNKKKQIPGYWRNMNETQFRFFLNALINTDGSPAHDNIIWRTTSKSDIDIISEVCIKLNYDCNVQEITSASGYKSDRQQYQMSIGKDKRLDHKVKYKIIEYCDDTYCLKTKNGTLITRYKLCPVITGNCFDMLYAMPVSEWHGGKVHFIRPSVIHLMRGQIFNIENKTFWTFGGASSHDIRDGILEIDDPRLRKWRYDYEKQYRVNHISWWKEELPSAEEMEEGRKNLENINNKVDFIVTHCGPTSSMALFSQGIYKPDILTDYFEDIRQRIDFGKWLMGHYHTNHAINEKEIILYEQIVRIV